MLLTAPCAFGERQPAKHFGTEVHCGLRWHEPEDEVLSIITGDGPWSRKVWQVQQARRRAALGAAVALRCTEEEVAYDMLSAQALRDIRCKSEVAKEAITWSPITIEDVKQKHTQSSPGVFYGLEFPWTAQGLVERGPDWLTEAFHAAGTMPRSNWITRITIEKYIKITAGNNAAKFLFEVTYAQQSPHLHTQLFAKVAFPCNYATTTDRLSSSVYKQPMDFLELNTYRCLEASLPVNTPKFYYGDISNETSNYILITERIPFSEIHGINLDKPLRPFDIEGPYDKCKDWLLRGEDKEYYLLLIEQCAKIAGAYKRGATPWNYGSPPTAPEAYGLNPTAPTGENPAACRSKLVFATRFMAETAAALFPPYVCEESFQRRWLDAMTKLNAYSAELRYWKMKDADYVALGHGNLNTDNAYFWRDRLGTLECGIFDFGGFGVSSLPHNLWWMLNMAEADQVVANLDTYIEAFVNRYEVHGGPRLTPDVVKMMIIITAMQNCMVMVAAIPNSLKMCSAKEFATIKDRHDPRVAENVDGKSTLRSCIHVLNGTIRLFEELHGAEVLEEWIQEVYVKQWGCFAKENMATYNIVEQEGTTRWG